MQVGARPNQMPTHVKHTKVILRSHAVCVCAFEKVDERRNALHYLPERASLSAQRAPQCGAVLLARRAAV